jgi:hypothetical protein
MFRTRFVGAVASLLGFSASACTVVPPLAEDDIGVAEIVQRVKCEIWEAAPVPSGKYPTGPYQWMRDWTAKVDLTLTTNDMGNVTPAASFLTPMTPQTLPGIGSFSRMFTFGVGGGVNTSASRTETLSFTLSFAELRNKFYRGECAPAEGLGLLGNLGLKEWMHAALAPASGPYPALTLGYHAATSSAKAATPSAGTPKITTQLVTDPIDRKIAEITATLDTAQGYADEAKTYGQQAQALSAKLKSDDLTKPPAEFASEIQKTADLASQSQDATDQANNGISNADKQLAELQKLPGASTNPKVPQEAAHVSATEKNIQNELAPIAKVLQATIGNLPPNPPIDAISHQTQFIVTLSANAAPNWTLVHFHGPETGSSLFSASRGFTHTLNIAMGSPSNNGLNLVGAEQLRQLNYLQTQAAFVNALQQAPPASGF